MLESQSFSSSAAHPNFLVKPKDQRVGMNGIAKFECQATGNPPPSVFWTKEGSQELMFAGTTHGQMFVSEEGTLTIQVNTSEYSCKIQITYMIRRPCKKR